MPKKATPAPAPPKWTPEQLMSVKGMGPGVIGQEMYDAAQAYVKTTNEGKFGPALIKQDDPRYSQAGPIAIRDGVPIFAEATA